MVRGVFALGIFLSVCGCSPGLPTAGVSGIVTLDGKPIGQISVTFQPQGTLPSGERGVDSYGLTDSAGRFNLKLVTNDADGAIVGSHKVLFADASPESTAPGPDAGVAPPKPTRIPVKYAESVESFEVKAGVSNVANFDLKSK